VPFYQEARKLVKTAGKILEGHWCGRTETLLPLVPGCGLDVVEAIVTRPMAKIGLSEALDLLRGEVVLQGGIPSVLVCRETCTDREFEAYIGTPLCRCAAARGSRWHVGQCSPNANSRAWRRWPNGLTPGAEPRQRPVGLDAP